MSEKNAAANGAVFRIPGGSLPARCLSRSTRSRSGGDLQGTVAGRIPVPVHDRDLEVRVS
ncbi:MAG: hypothetical protein LUQ35_03460 [Methanoregula sp.]|nr:hypothetical protein [Methanoregula sp.]